jgi:hypothetical protein
MKGAAVTERESTRRPKGIETERDRERRSARQAIRHQSKS